LVEDITYNELKNKLASSSKPFLVDIWAKWCLPCSKIKPAVERLSQEYNGKMNFYTLDLSKEPDIMELGVRSIPTILFIKDGEIAGMVVGAVSYGRLRNEVDKVLGIEREHLR